MWQNVLQVKIRIGNSPTVIEVVVEGKHPLFVYRHLIFWFRGAEGSECTNGFFGTENSSSRSQSIHLHEIKMIFKPLGIAPPPSLTDPARHPPMASLNVTHQQYTVLQLYCDAVTFNDCICKPAKVTPLNCYCKWWAWDFADDILRVPPQPQSPSDSLTPDTTTPLSDGNTHKGWFLRFYQLSSVGVFQSRILTGSSIAHLLDPLGMTSRIFKMWSRNLLCLFLGAFAIGQTHQPAPIIRDTLAHVLRRHRQSGHF